MTRLKSNKGFLLTFLVTKAYLGDFVNYTKRITARSTNGMLKTLGNQRKERQR